MSAMMSAMTSAAVTQKITALTVPNKHPENKILFSERGTDEIWVIPVTTKIIARNTIKVGSENQKTRKRPRETKKQQ